MNLVGCTVQSHKRRGAGHEGRLRVLDLDVHAETIAVAVPAPEGEVRSLGTIPNQVEFPQDLKNFGSAEKLRACYDAGPAGYVVHWQLAELGIQCEIVDSGTHSGTGQGVIV